MDKQTFFKEVIKSFLKSFFKVLGFGFALITLFFCISFFSTGGAAQGKTMVEVLPDHTWRATSYSTERPTILKISIDGIIGIDNKADDVRLQLLETIDIALKQHQIRGIILAIDSPGGKAIDGDGIYRMLKEYKKRYKLPVYAYVDGLCASGGMYIACAADKIYATDISLIGHVGVILPPFFNFSTAMKKLGIESKTVYAGKGKDDMNPFRPWNENDQKNWQHSVDDMYFRFVSVVAENRPKLTREILLDQGAKVYPAKEAEEQGYIDGRVELIDDVIYQLAKDVGIEKDYQFVQLSTSRFFDAFVSMSEANSLLTGKIKHTIELSGELPKELQGTPLYLWTPAGTHN